MLQLWTLPSLPYFSSLSDFFRRLLSWFRPSSIATTWYLLQGSPKSAHMFGNSEKEFPCGYVYPTSSSRGWSCTGGLPLIMPSCNPCSTSTATRYPSCFQVHLTASTKSFSHASAKGHRLPLLQLHG